MQCLESVLVRPHTPEAAASTTLAYAAIGRCDVLLTSKSSSVQNLVCPIWWPPVLRALSTPLRRCPRICNMLPRNTSPSLSQNRTPRMPAGRLPFPARSQAHRRRSNPPPRTRRSWYPGRLGGRCRLVSMASADLDLISWTIQLASHTLTEIYLVRCPVGIMSAADALGSSGIRACSPTRIEQ